MAVLENLGTIRMLLGEMFNEFAPVSILQDGYAVEDVARELAGRDGSEDAFFVLDLDDIVRKFKLWQLRLPRVKPFYAVKCNQDIRVLQLLAFLEAGFDCASKAEIDRVLSLGVPTDRVIYANPCKTTSYIRFAAQNNVKRMTFDNEMELRKISQNFPDAELVIRIRCDALHSQCPLGAKFGVDPPDVLPLLEAAASLGLNVVGVSFHVGSGCNDASAFPRAIAEARRVFELGQSLGYSFKLLDIGGGFPGHQGHGISFDQLSEGISDALDAHFPECMGVEIIGEPGRYFVSSAFTLATCIIARRDEQREERVKKASKEEELILLEGEGSDGEYSDEESAKKGVMYYVNDGVYGSFNCLLYDHATVEPRILEEPEPGPSEPLYPSSIWGPTCDSLDCICPNILLPRLDVGQWLLWKNMGAYTLAAATTFNGFPLSRIHPIISERAWNFLLDLEKERYGDPPAALIPDGPKDVEEFPTTEVPWAGTEAMLPLGPMEVTTV